MEEAKHPLILGTQGEPKENIEKLEELFYDPEAYLTLDK